MLPIILSLKMVGRIGYVNKCYWDVFEKTIVFSITKMFVQLFLHVWYVMRMSTRVISVLTPPAAKKVICLTEILFSTFVTSKDISQAFLHAVIFVIDFVSLSCNCHGKNVRLMNICTYLVTWSFTGETPYCPFNWIQIQLSSNQVTTYLSRTAELHSHKIDISCHKQSSPWI